MFDESAEGLGTQLRRLLELLDGEVGQIYREDHPFYVPRYTPVMKALAGGKAITIKGIAEKSSVSHSAASQTVSKLEKHGLVQLETDVDKRSRKVSLSPEGQRLLPWLSRRWAATTAAASELDRELDSPLSELLRQAIDHLEQRSFADRIRTYEKKEDAPT